MGTLGPNEQAFEMYWCIRYIWNPRTGVASCVDKLDDTLPRFMGVQWDSI
jgi:hypothetical protein